VVTRRPPGTSIRSPFRPRLVQDSTVNLRIQDENDVPLGGEPDMAHISQQTLVAEQLDRVERGMAETQIQPEMIRLSSERHSVRDTGSGERTEGRFDHIRGEIERLGHEMEQLNTTIGELALQRRALAADLIPPPGYSSQSGR
jgi:hypothetical protein